MSTFEFEKHRLSGCRMLESGTHGSEGAQGDDTPKLPTKIALPDIVIPTS